MNRQTARQLLGILVVILVGVIVLVAVLASCTLVLIRGNDNTTTDTGGHGGGLTVERAPAKPTLMERLEHQGQPTQGGSK